MAIMHPREGQIFEAADGAPSAIDFLDGRRELEDVTHKLVIENVRRSGSPDSIVFLDETVSPPVLKLTRALIDLSRRDGFDKTGGTGFHTVSGEYKGPGSELELY